MDVKNEEPKSNINEPLYCCRKMHDVLRYENSNFRAAKPNLVSVYAGNTVMVTSKKTQAIIRIIKEKKDEVKKEIKSKKTFVYKPSDDEIKEQITKHNIMDKITKVQMTEIISFCPFCGKKLSGQ